MRALALIFVAGLMSAGAMAASIDHYTAADLDKIAATLRAQSGAKGQASQPLQTYSGHRTMLAYRAKDGIAEIHQHEADVFIILRGKATLVTEGKAPQAVEKKPGEVRGGPVVDGKSTELAPGDIVNIPAGVPHQVLVAPGQEILYLVVKTADQ